MPERPGNHSIELSLGPGRRLCWAPDWDCSDERVLFDGASGDYWLLDDLACRLVHALQERARLSWAEAVALAPDAQALRAHLHGLQRSGLVRACQNGEPVRLSLEALD